MKTDETMIQNQTQEDWLTNDALWDDKAVFTNEWRLILVDFGFARALTPKEVLQNNSTSVRSLVQRTIEEKGNEADATDTPLAEEKSRPIKKQSSFQKVQIRAMSAIGTRAFAAPEVQRARDKTEKESALSTFVADYGLVSDAYSVGATIKMILTGVPAGENEMAFISANDSAIGKILDAICGCGKKSDGKRRKRYKFLDETPKPARDLVEKLLKAKEEERLTVPLAREEPWIKGGMNDNDPVIQLPAGDHPAGNDDLIECLKCAGQW
jgi:serine/threonine protein kinase